MSKGSWSCSAAPCISLKAAVAKLICKSEGGTPAPKEEVDGVAPAVEELGQAVVIAVADFGLVKLRSGIGAGERDDHVQAF